MDEEKIPINKMKYHVLFCRVPARIKTAIEEEAWNKGISINELCIHIFDEHLKRANAAETKTEVQKLFRTQDPLV